MIVVLMFIVFEKIFIVIAKLALYFFLSKVSHYRARCKN